MPEYKLYCNYCDMTIDNNSMTPCKCPIYFHYKCWKIYENKNDIVLKDSCHKCNTIFNIDFINQYYKKLYNISQFLFNIYIPLIYIIYLIGIITIWYDKYILLNILSIFNFIISIYILYLDINIKKKTSVKLFILIIISICNIILIFTKVNIWIYFSVLFILHTILLKLKKYLYIYSAKYLYIECKHFCRINSII